MNLGNLTQYVEKAKAMEKAYGPYATIMAIAQLNDLPRDGKGCFCKKEEEVCEWCLWIVMLDDAKTDEAKVKALVEVLGRFPKKILAKALKQVRAKK